MHHAVESVFPDVEMEKSLKSGEHGSVHLVRDKETKTRYIYREFSGSGEVYQKLQEIGKQVTNASAGIYLGGRDFFAGGLVAFNRGQFVKMNGTAVSENLSDPRIYNAYKKILK